jgi:hypothetical protein
MRAVSFLAVVLLGGCSSLIANFEDDRVGGPPSPSPAGYPDDEIVVSSPFQGSVRGLPISDPTGLRTGRQSLEVLANSSVTFRSQPIPEAQQTSRHTVSFLFSNETARGKTISFLQGGGTAVRFRLVGDTLAIRGADAGDEQTFSIRTLGAASLVTIIVNPPTGRTRVIWRTGSETISWATTFAAPGEGRVTRFTLNFTMDNGGAFPRGRIAIDDVRATWSPEITVRPPS